jgi:iduronate 2-sulfatase
MKKFVPFLIALVIVSCSAPMKQSPNVLFIFVDDLRPQLGCYGHQQMKTPNIDHLAGEGLLFNSSYCNIPVCGASRASIMSGMRGTPSRFVHWFTKLEEDAPEAISLPGYFKENGYNCVSLGKTFHHKEDCKEDWSKLPWGPDQYSEKQWAGKGYLNEENKAFIKENGGLNAFYCEVAGNQSGPYPDEVTADKAIEHLRTLKGENTPFFLAVGFFKPHLPFNAPRDYWDMYEASEELLAANPGRPENAPSEAFYSLQQLGQSEGWPATDEEYFDVYPTKELRSYQGIPKSGAIPDSIAIKLVQGYSACVSYTDALVGRVLDELKRLRMEDNTIVVLLGDHGWQLGEHELWCKHCNFRTALQAPLIIKVPGKKGGMKTDALTEFVDVYPTLCELCGLDIPSQVEGSSLVTLLNDPDAEVKDEIFLRFMAGNTVKTSRYSYTEYYDNEGGLQGNMLYDHMNDPNENRNLATEAEYEQLILKFRNRLLEVWPELRD